MSLYGLKKAPKTFFDKLKAGLEERGFEQSQMDACLFMKLNMICLVYVDDTILASPDSKAIEREITGLGVSTDEQRHQLRDEDGVGDFLGIRIEKLGSCKFNLTQTGLINKVLKASNMETCNSVVTLAFTTALGSDKDHGNMQLSLECSCILQAIHVLIFHLRCTNALDSLMCHNTLMPLQVYSQILARYKRKGSHS